MVLLRIASMWREAGRNLGSNVSREFQEALPIASFIHTFLNLLPEYSS